MGHSPFLLLLLVSSFLFLTFGYGFGRVAPMETYDDFNDEDDALVVDNLQEIPEARRGPFRYSVSDYPDPQPNTNPKNGYIFSPPSPTPTPPPSA